MSMSKSTAAVANMARSINTAAISSQRKAGAVLMPKYADLLRNRRGAEHSDSSRGLTTTHRPTPQPSLVNRSKPLMQTFHTSVPPTSTPAANLDAAIIPNLGSFSFRAVDEMAVPFLPDNYGAVNHFIELPESRTQAGSSEPTIVAANPDMIVPGAPMAEIESLGVGGFEGVNLQFVHEGGAKQESGLGNMLKGMVDDVFGAKKSAA